MHMPLHAHTLHAHGMPHACVQTALTPHVHVHVHVQAHAHVHVHVHVHAHEHVHVHVHVQVSGSGSNVYTLKRTGDVYSCSCPAW